MLLVYSSGSTLTIWKDHSRRTVHAATIKDSRPGHVFPFHVPVLFRGWGLLDWVDYLFLGATDRFEKAAMEFGIWEGGTLLFSFWDQNPWYLFTTTGREETAKASASAARLYHGRSHLSKHCRSSVLLITGLWETGTSKDKGTWLRSGA